MNALVNGHLEEVALQSRTQRPRLFQLDALRGLAALMVVCSHVLLAFPMGFDRWRIELFSMGRSAVILFFVLSGYVLSLPYWNGRTQPYHRYVVRRFCRIYLPFAAAAVLAICGGYYFHNVRLPLSIWFQLTWHTNVTAHRILKQFLMFPIPDFNTAFWSLTYEMQMSIVMPFVCWLLRRLNPILFLTALSLLMYFRPLVLRDSPNYIWMSLQVLLLFCWGSSLAYYERPLSEVLRRSGRASWGILLVSIFLYVDGPLLLSLRHPIMFGHIFVRDYLINGLGAGATIVLSLQIPWFARLLKHEVPEYLGRISYSFYLTHATVIFALFDLFYGRISNWTLIAVTMLSMVVVGHLFCIAVEEPSMRLGKWLASLGVVKSSASA